MSSSLSRRETWSLLSLSLACIAVIFQTFQGDGAPLIASLAFSGLAFALSYALIRWLGHAFIKAGLRGRDMSKKDPRDIPETMGAVCAIVYLLAIITFIPFPFYKDIVAATSGGGNRDLIREAEQVDSGRFLHRFPHSKLASYLSAILSLQSIVLLGFGDDLFDIRWRHKLFIPALASIPMLIVYFVDFGVTKVVIPTPLKPYLGDLFDLGWAYYAYMAGICIFCPNSINILAGINGIEVLQSIIIAILILLNDLLYLYPAFFRLPVNSNANNTLLSTPQPPPTHNPSTDPHLFSIYLLLPFLAVSLALLPHNIYPARVFVGDTFCYFAGMVFAVVAILAHFSKTLLLLFLPQIFNFIYSAPQLFGLVPCPRHRLPHFNARTELLEASWADWCLPKLDDEDVNETGDANGRSLNGHANAGKSHGRHSRAASRNTGTPVPSPAPPGAGGLPRHRRTRARTTPLHPLIQQTLKLLAAIRLVQVETEHEDGSGNVVRCTNLTLLNLWLVWFGPMREDRLAISLSCAQAAAGLFGLWVRHQLALLVFEVDNLRWR